MFMLWIWKNSCTRLDLTWSSSTILQKNALLHEQINKKGKKMKQMNVILVEVCHGCEEFHKAIGHWNPWMCAKMHPHFGCIWWKTWALRICGSLDLPFRQIQICHSSKLPMNVTHLLMFINLGGHFHFNENNVQKNIGGNLLKKIKNI
jgi:hypothetical protein